MLNKGSMSSSACEAADTMPPQLQPASFVIFLGMAYISEQFNPHDQRIIHRTPFLLATVGF